MTPAEGQKALKRLLGAQAGWRDNKQAAKPDERQHCATVYPDAKGTYETLKAQRDARMRELLNGDAEYARLTKETLAAREEMEHVGRRRHSYRLTVGLNKTWCFEVKAEGDNWADVIRKLEAEVK